MTAELKAAVEAYLEDHADVSLPPPPYDLPMFNRPDPDTVEWVSGRPEVTAFSEQLLELADQILTWDGECLRMPGDLRYQPTGWTTDRNGPRSVVCRRVDP